MNLFVLLVGLLVVSPVFGAHFQDAAYREVGHTHFRKIYT